MAQAQLDTLHYRELKHQNQFIIQISEDFHVKIRRKKNQTVALFFYKNKKSFSIPYVLLQKLVIAQDIFQLAAELIDGTVLAY